MNKVIIVGYGGHAKSVADSIERVGAFEIIGYTDIEKRESAYNYLGNDAVIDDYFRKGIRKLIIGVGFLGRDLLRENLYKKYKKLGFDFPTVVDPSAIISDSACLEEGVFVGKGAIINANSYIGKMAIINSKALVEHDCFVGDYSHIAVGAVVCGGTRICERVLVGANATIIQGMTVEAESIIPAGSVVR